VAWIAAHRVRIAGARIAGVVAAGALIASLAVPGDRGLTARYYATASASGAHERSPDNRDRDFTRVDDRLDFVRDIRDFHLSFFNDHTRFNFMQEGQPNRRHLEFAVAWTGWWFTADPTQTIYLHAPQANAQVAVDSEPALSSNPQSTGESRAITLTPGWHRLHVTFSSPYGAPREFSAGVMRNGVREPFDAATVRTERIDRRQEMVAQVLAIVKPAADLIALGWLASIAGLVLVRRLGEVWQQRLAAHRAAFAVFIAAGAAEALRFAWPWADRFRNMVAGDDTMVYEAYARDILFNGILMNGGQPLGQGEPFYFQAFYPYFLAATHAVFGEGFFGALFLQRVLVAATAIVLTLMAMLLWRRSAWPAALGVAAGFLYWKLAPISADMLNESLYVPLLAVSTLSLTRLWIEPQPVGAVRAGLLGGVTAITRSTAMLSWAMVWVVMFRRLRGARLRLLAVSIACTLAVFSLIAVRNALVSHRFVPASTEFGITLRAGNEPPAGVALDAEPRLALYNRLGVDGYTIEVIEYALAAPGHFAGNMARKALFVLGFYEAYAAGWGYSPVYIVAWIGAAAGVVFARQAGVAWMPLALPLIVALMQFAAIVIVYPKGERLIVPIHTLLIPYTAIAADRLITLILGHSTTADVGPAPTTLLRS
jgi:hypothetical protein